MLFSALRLLLSFNDSFISQLQFANFWQIFLAAFCCHWSAEIVVELHKRSQNGEFFSCGPILLPCTTFIDSGNRRGHKIQNHWHKMAQIRHKILAYKSSQFVVVGGPTLPTSAFLPFSFFHFLTKNVIGSFWGTSLLSQLKQEMFSCPFWNSRCELVS